MKLYQVIYQDDGEDIKNNIFHLALLEMCRPSKHCGCYDEGRMDICDHAFTETDDIQIATDKVEWLKKNGTVRAWIKEIR